MIYIREGSHVYLLISLLAYVGEYPVQSLDLLGSERTWKALIQRLTKVQEFCLTDTGEHFRCRLLTVSGNGRYRTVRFHLSALVILEKLNLSAYNYYLDHFDGHHFSGNQYHIERNHRVTEAVVMCMNAGIETRPHMLPDPKDPNVYSPEITELRFYLSRELKKFWEREMNKTQFSRIVGAIVYGGNCYTVYNSRDTLMKWNGNGESKVQSYLSNVWARGAMVFTIKSAILFGQDYLVAMRTLEESARRRRFDLRFDNVYPHIHFIPMNAFGVKMLRTITVDNWNEEHRYMLYGDDGLNNGYRSIEYDAIIDGRYCLSHLDGDLCRLIRAKDALDKRPDIQYEITCYPEQLSMVKEYMSEFRGKGRLFITTVTIDQVCEYFFGQ